MPITGPISGLLQEKDEDEPGLLGEAAKGFASGVVGLAESVGTGLEYVGGKVDDQDLIDLGHTVETYWNDVNSKNFQAHESLRGPIYDPDKGLNTELLSKGAWWTYNVANIIPSIAASMIPAAGATKAASALKIGEKVVRWTPSVAAKLGRLGRALTSAEAINRGIGATVGGLVGGSLEGANTYQEVLQRGGTREEAEAGAEQMTFASGALNMLSLNQMMQKLPPGLVGNATRRLINGLTEGITEWLEEPAEAYIKTNLAGKDGSKLKFTPEDAANQVYNGLNVLPPSIISGMLFGGGEPASVGQVADERGIPEPTGPLSTAAQAIRREVPFTEEGALRRAETLTKQGAPHTVAPHPLVPNRFTVIPEVQDASAIRSDEGQVLPEVQGAREAEPGGVHEAGKNAGGENLQRQTQAGAEAGHRPQRVKHHPELIDKAAHEAATSPRNDLAEPTEAQKEAGNYKKGHTTIQGLDITIENPQGSVRSGVSEKGESWKQKLAHHYGYIKRTEGADGDQVDTFIGPNPESQNAYVVNQINPETGKFDEHKVLLGFDSKEAAAEGYHANYENGWAGMGDIVEMPMEELKAWLREGDTKTPISGEVSKFNMRPAKDGFNTKYRRVPTSELNTGISKVTGPEDAAHILAPLRKGGEEVFYALVLDKDGNVLDVQSHSKGARDGASVYPEVVGPAIAGVKGAKSVYFSHNHPSGVSDPSRADFAITDRLSEYLDGANINIAGHIVLGHGANADYFAPGDQSGKKISIKPLRRTEKVAITEKRIRKVPPRERVEITSPMDAIKVVDGVSATDALILMDNRHKYIGTLEMTPEEMGSLRKGDRIKELLSVIDETNAVAGIIKTSDEGAAKNLSSYLNADSKLRLLDIIVPKSEEFNDRSLANRGVMEDGVRSFKMSPPDVTEEPYRNADGSYRKNKSGDITGAPPGVKNEAGISAIVKKNIARIESMFEVDEKRASTLTNWYEISGNAIRAITRKDKELAEKVVRILSFLSADNQVGGNVTGMIKAAYQLANGEEVAAGRYPVSTKGKIETIIAAKEFNKELPGVDDKVMNFYRNLYDATFQTDKYEDAATMDLWMARLYDYPEVDRIEYGKKTGKTNRLGQAQYRFANMLTRRIAEEYNKKHGTNWKPRQVQAALWGYARDDAAKQKGSKQKPVADFSTYLSRATEHVTTEAIPSTSLPTFQSIHSAPIEVRLAYTKAAMAVVGKDGRDELLEMLRAPLYGGEYSAGTFEGAINPNKITDIVAKKVKGDNGKLVYDREIADLYAIAQMYMHSQDAVPWFRLDPTLTPVKAGGGVVSKGVAISFKSKPDANTLESFYNHLREFVPDGEVTVLGNDVLAINFRDPATNKPWGMPDAKFIEAVTDAANTFDAAGNDIIEVLDNVKAEGAYHAIYDYETSWETPEEAVSKLEAEISRRGRPDLLPWLRDRRREIERIQADFQNGKLKKYEVASRPIVEFLEQLKQREQAYRRLKEVLHGRLGDYANLTTKSNFKVKVTRVEDMPAEAHDQFQKLYMDVRGGTVGGGGSGDRVVYRQATVEESKIISAILNDLMDAGMPASVLQTVEDIGVFDATPDYDTSASFIPAQYVASIGAFKNSLWIKSEYLELADETGDETLGKVLRSIVAHELGHAIDVGSEQDMETHASSDEAQGLFKIDPLKFEAVPARNEFGIKVKGERGAFGTIVEEALKVYDSRDGKAAGIRGMLHYPLVDILRYRLIGAKVTDILGDTTVVTRELLEEDERARNYLLMQASEKFRMVQGELFAQLHSLYYTYPEEMEHYLPKGYALMQEVHNVAARAKDAVQLDRGIREALRTSSAELRPVRTQQQLFAEVGPRGGVKKWRAGEGLGRAEQSGVPEQTAVGGVSSAAGVRPQVIPYRKVPKGQIPTKTRKAYKLMRMMKSEAGMLFPLYAKPQGVRQGFTMGEWYRAENQRPTIGKLLAERPGIHGVALPMFDQGKAKVNGESRVWVEVEMPAISEKTQAESDNSPKLANGMRTGISSRLIGPSESYDYKTNQTAKEAGGWPIAGSMKILRVLSDAEVKGIIEKAGKKYSEKASATGVTDADAKRINDQLSSQIKKWATQDVRGNTAFASWFGNSKVVDEDGNPLEVYHGTTHDFNAFSTIYANPENYMGAGFYFTDSLDDVNPNYAGEGPDLTLRIEKEKERIEDEDQMIEKYAELNGLDYEYAWEKWGKLDDKVREWYKTKVAKDNLGIESHGAIMPVFLKMENPVEVEPNGGTYFETSWDEDYYKGDGMAADEVDQADYTDEDGELDEDAYNEALEEKASEMFYEDYNPELTGNAAELGDIILDVAYEFGIDGAALRQKFMEEHNYPMDYRQSAYDFSEWLRSQEETFDAYDDEGRMTGYEMVREVFERMGFDGIIMDAEAHFGARQINIGGGSIPVQGMGGVYGAKHYIAFSPSQIKSSIGNTGEYTSSPSITMSNKGKQFGQEAAAVQQQVDDIASAWRGGPKVEVLSHRNMLPERLAKEALRSRGRVEGVFDAGTGTVYLIADALPSSVDVARVMLHEVFGHWAPSQKLGAEFEPLLERVYESYGQKRLQGIADRHGVDLNTREGRLIAAQEKMAEIAETGLNPTLLNKLSLMLKNILNKLGIKVRLTNGDIRAILANAGRMVYEGDSVVASGTLQPLLSQTSVTFYSQMQEHLRDKLPGKGKPGQLRAVINNMAKKGQFKQEELEWSGLIDWLGEQEGTVTKEQVLEFLQENAIEIDEVTLGGLSAEDDGLDTSVSTDGPNKTSDGDVYYTYEASDGYQYEAKGGEEEGWTLYDEDERVVRDDEGVITVDRIDEMEQYVISANEKRMMEPYETEQAIIGAEGPARYENWTEGGIKRNYRELLLRLPAKLREQSPEHKTRVDELRKKMIAGEELTYDEYGEWNMLQNEADKINADYRSQLNTNPHYDDYPNILAHIRFDTRTDIDGKKVLFIEEVQSDWHQEGRKKGYKPKDSKLPTNMEIVEAYNQLKPLLEQEDLLGFDTVAQAISAIMTHDDYAERWEITNPTTRMVIDRYKTLRNLHEGSESTRGTRELVADAPFKTSWPLLAMKRMIRYAAENGYDRIAWTTGKQQAERYNLSKQVERVEVNERDDGGYNVLAFVHDDGSSPEISRYAADLDEVAGIVGKEIAKKVEAGESIFTGEKLNIGGEGMQAFYDKMLPSMVGKYIKKWGGKVGSTKIVTKDNRGVTMGELRSLGLDRHPFVTHTDLRGDEPSYSVENRITGEVIPFENRDLADIYITEQIGIMFASEQWSIDITPEMREAAMNGQVLFSLSDKEAATQSSRRAIDTYRMAAKSVVDWLDNHLNPLATLPHYSRFMKGRRRTVGRIAMVNELVHRINSIFSQATEDEAKAIYSYWTNSSGELANPGRIPDRALKIRRERGTGQFFKQEQEVQLRQQAVAVKRLIHRLGRDLVEHGLIPAMSYKEFENAYLPRLYLAHLLDDKSYQRVVGGKKPSMMGYSKKRNLDLDDVTRLVMGEIKDPAYVAAKTVGVPLRDIAILDFLEEISQEPDWAVQNIIVNYGGKRVTAYWLVEEGEATIARAKHMKGDEATFVRSVGADMVATGHEALEEAFGEGFDEKQWAQVPNTPRYGALRGLWVRREIYNDMLSTITSVHGDSAMEKLLGQGGIATKATQIWKMMKVPLNPPSQVRNFVSNGVLMNLGGVPIRRIPGLVVRALQEIRTNGKYWRHAKREGVTESTFVANELIRIDRELLALKKRMGEDVNVRDYLMELGAIVTNFASDSYQFSEGLFKTAMIIDGMERQKMDAGQAAEYANKWLFDYSLVGPNVKYLRNAPVGVPFITFYMKAFPRMVETLFLHPQRFAPYMAVPMLMAQAIAQGFDVDDDDLDKLKKALPKWLQERGHTMILPTKDANGRWQAFDYGYFLPWGMFWDAAKDVGAGEPGELIKTLGIFGGPVPEVITAIKGGTDSFTGRPIYYEGDPPQQQFEDILLYLARMAAPSWLTDRGAVGHMYRALTGHVDPRTGEPTATAIQAAMRFVGMNIYPIDPEYTRARNLMFMQLEMRDIMGRMRTKLRDRNLSDSERKEIRDEYGKYLQQKAEQIREYAEASQVHPNLRVK